MKNKKTFLKNGEVCIGLYVNELKDDKDFQVIVSDILYLVDTKKIKEKYEIISWEYQGKTYLKYEVLLDDLIPIGSKSEEEDSNISMMTIRDFYCIIHNVGNSNKKWLNNLINKNQKNG